MCCENAKTLLARAFIYLKLYQHWSWIWINLCWIKRTSSKLKLVWRKTSIKLLLILNLWTPSRTEPTREPGKTFTPNTAHLPHTNTTKATMFWVHLSNFAHFRLFFCSGELAQNTKGPGEPFMILYKIDCFFPLCFGLNVVFNNDIGVLAKCVHKMTTKSVHFRSRQWGSSLPGLCTLEPPLGPPST